VSSAKEGEAALFRLRAWANPRPGANFPVFQTGLKAIPFLLSTNYCSLLTAHFLLSSEDCFSFPLVVSKMIPETRRTVRKTEFKNLFLEMVKKDMTSRVAVIGAGSWGTTLANLIAEKEDVDLWVYEEDLYQTMIGRRENEIYLPGIRLADRIRPTHSLEEAFREKAVLVCAVPSHAVRKVFQRGLSHLGENTLIISVTKGVEDETHLRMSQIIREANPRNRSLAVACLSGPSFAKEVSRRFPTAVAIAGETPEAAEKARNLFSRSYFRIYTNPDMIGVELGGAIKNVMAIAAGASDGLGFGNNTRAALITRGLAEMTRLGVNLGAEARTFAGLAGLGDLVLTCTGDLSRNRWVGLELGKGRKPGEIQGEMKMVAEGIRTTKALYHLAQKREVEMPITEQVYKVLFEGKEPRSAVMELMTRDPRSEKEG
jgi:glycerol-3-phosphate dehydrogenase (NAD(P)+)